MVPRGTTARQGALKSKREPEDVLQLGEMTCFNHAVGLIEHQESKALDLRGQTFVLSEENTISIKVTVPSRSYSNLFHDIPQPAGGCDEDIDAAI